MEQRSIVIVGASHAGFHTAKELRRRGFDGRVTVVGEEHHPPYDRPPLSKQLLAGHLTADDVRLASREQLAELDITTRLGTAARAADPDGHTVTLDDGNRLPYTELVLATGVAPRPFPGGVTNPRVHTIKTLEDASRLAGQLLPGRRVAVIGSGFLGTEIAWTAAGRGCAVTLLGTAEFPLAGLGRLVGNTVGERMTAGGIEVVNSRSVRRIAHTADAAVLTLDDGTETVADVVVTAVGSTPNVEWLHGSGLHIDDGVRCDAYGRAAPRVYAVGDVANWYWPEHGRHIRVEHQMNAGEQARIVAANLLGAEQRLAPLPFFWSHQGGDRLVVYGHPTDSASFELAEGSVADNRFAGTYRDGGRHVAVLAWNAPKPALRLRQRAIEEISAQPVT